MKNKKKSSSIFLDITLPPKDREVLSRIRKEVEKADTALITFHARPDGDAVGGALALKEILNQKGVKASVISPTSPSRVFSFLKGFNEISTELPSKKRDLAFILDCSDSRRLEGLGKITSKAAGIINIDHHQLNQIDAKINYVRPDYSSICEMVLNLALECKSRIDPDMALCIYTGIITDTNRFQEKSTTARAHLIAASFVKGGISPVNVSSKIYGSMPLNKLRLISKCLDSIKVVCGGRIAYLVVTPEMLKETGTAEENLEGIINYPRSIEGVDVGILFRKIPGLKGVKVSFRSNGKADVGGVSAAFGGGGHHNAGGCLIEGDFSGAVSQVLEEVKKWME